MTDSEARNHATFQALMWALSHPGRAQILPGDASRALVHIAAALLDLETSCFSPDPSLAREIGRTGARALPPSQAAYQFFPELRAADLDLLRHAPAGTYVAPDEAATLVLGCELGRGRRLRLRGPGIQREAELQVGGLPEPFWELRAAAIRYPLGWDVLLVSGGRVIGLPRTTVVEVVWPT
jgi:alpha-D-ribose 1-methylphosphonate 5-triphosphate synthase subunit PhnH